MRAFSATGTGGGGGCTAAQLLGNPGFESGTSPWTASSGVVSTASGNGAQTSFLIDDTALNAS